MRVGLDRVGDPQPWARLREGFTIASSEAGAVDMNPPPLTRPFGAREDEMIKRQHLADEGTLIVRCQPKEARPLVAGGGDSGDRGHDDFEVSHVENSGGGAAERVAGDSRMHTSEDEWHVVAHRMRGKGSKGLRSGVGFDLSPSVEHQALVPVPESIHSSEQRVWDVFSFASIAP